ncbi:MAG: ABC-type multidrug transport system, ATPase component [Nitrosopumilales archaeon]|nr:MAG: ABC-type multidrug transport system, ATPase component [Nitrosopumilales archaeon]
MILGGRLNHIPSNIIDKRIDQILDLIELVGVQNETVDTYSGGMRKRLDLAGGLLHRPKVLFLDEPTVGLDIQTRRKIWDYIKKIHKEFNMTIFVSTHYMEEADKLCDRVGIIDYGKIQVIDSPQALKDKLGNEIITFKISENVSKTDLLSELKAIQLVKDITTKDDQVTVFASKGTELIPMIFQITSNLQIKINSISLTQPSLDDVFISYTGHELRDENAKYNQKIQYAKMRRWRD